MAAPKCSRCGRRMRSMNQWNVDLIGGVVVGLICPNCQTSEENAEAEINEATIDYSTDAFGRVVGAPKAVA